MKLEVVETIRMNQQTLKRIRQNPALEPYADLLLGNVSAAAGDLAHCWTVALMNDEQLIEWCKSKSSDPVETPAKRRAYERKPKEPKQAEETPVAQPLEGLFAESEENADAPVNIRTG